MGLIDTLRLPGALKRLRTAWQALVPRFWRFSRRAYCDTYQLLYFQSLTAPFHSASSVVKIGILTNSTWKIALKSFRSG
jgi:hypothetical protein